MTWTRLNVFQRLTRQWDSLHPYNAVQVMRLAGQADIERIGAAWQSTLRDLGLGMARVSGRQYQWESLNGEVPAAGHITVVPSQISLDQWITDELARPFEESASLPLRAFVLDRGDSSYYAGLVYHHWIADSYSIRLVMREWFLRLFDPSARRRAPIEIASDGYWRAFGPETRNWSPMSAMLDSLRWSARLRQSRRIRSVEFCDFRTHFSLHEAPDGLIGLVATAARQRGVSVHDVLMAAMACVCNRAVPAREKGRRRDLMLGSIVDLRMARAERGRSIDQFGLFLGFMNVYCREHELTDFDGLLRVIHRQNALQKRSCAAEASMMRMTLALGLAKALSRKRLLEFYRKRVAMAAGISNVNLNSDWPARYHPDVLMEYFRVSPCGPMMPVVFTPTTLGEKLNFGLTCRHSLIAPGRPPREMAQRFFGHLRDFVAT